MVFEARIRFEDNGFAYILWGAVIAVASFSQAYLIHLEKYTISWYPYVLMPLVGVFTFVYYAKKRAKEEKPYQHYLLAGMDIYFCQRDVIGVCF